jgi:hypothetical protein
MANEHGFMSYVLQAKFASALDAMDYYERKKMISPSIRLILIDTVHHQQIDVFV